MTNSWSINILFRIRSVLWGFGFCEDRYKVHHHHHHSLCTMNNGNNWHASSLIPHEWECDFFSLYFNDVIYFNDVPHTSALSRLLQFMINLCQDMSRSIDWTPAFDWDQHEAGTTTTAVVVVVVIITTTTTINNIYKIPINNISNNKHL